MLKASLFETCTRACIKALKISHKEHYRVSDFGIFNIPKALFIPKIYPIEPVEMYRLMGLLFLADLCSSFVFAPSALRALQIQKWKPKGFKCLRWHKKSSTFLETQLQRPLWLSI